MTPVAAGNVTATTAGVAIPLTALPSGINFYVVELRNEDQSTMAYFTTVPGLTRTTLAYELPAASGSDSKDATNIRRFGPYKRDRVPYVVTETGTASIHYVVEALTDEAV